MSVNSMLESLCASRLFNWLGSKVGNDFELQIPGYLSIVRTTTGYLCVPSHLTALSTRRYSS